MSGYIGVNLKDMIEQIGEVETKAILSDFSCPLNPDVEKYLKHTAIEFYSNNGFVNFGKRYLDRDETDLSGDYLIQMLKYMN